MIMTATTKEKVPTKGNLIQRQVGCLAIAFGYHQLGNNKYKEMGNYFLIASVKYALLLHCNMNIFFQNNRFSTKFWIFKILCKKKILY